MRAGKAHVPAKAPILPTAAAVPSERRPRDEEGMRQISSGDEEEKWISEKEGRETRVGKRITEDTTD